MHACSSLLSQLGGGGYGRLESRGQGFCSEPHAAQAHPPPRTTQPQMLVALRLEAPGCRVQAATEDADPSAKSWLPPAHGPLASPGTKLLCLLGQRSTAEVRRDRGSRAEGQRGREHAGERNRCSLQKKQSRQKRETTWRGKVKCGEMQGPVKERRPEVPPGEQRL